MATAMEGARQLGLRSTVAVQLASPVGMHSKCIPVMRVSSSPDWDLNPLNEHIILM